MQYEIGYISINAFPDCVWRFGESSAPVCGAGQGVPFPLAHLRLCTLYIHVGDPVPDTPTAAGLRLIETGNPVPHAAATDHLVAAASPFIRIAILAAAGSLHLGELAGLSVHADNAPGPGFRRRPWLSLQLLATRRLGVEGCGAEADDGGGRVLDSLGVGGQLFRVLQL